MFIYIKYEQRKTGTYIWMKICLYINEIKILIYIYRDREREKEIYILKNKHI